MNDEENREQREQTWRALAKGREQVDKVLNSLGKKPNRSGAETPSSAGSVRD